MPETRSKRSDYTPEAWAAKLERQRRWRASHADEQRRIARERYAEAAISRPVFAPIPLLHTGHPLFDVAYQLVPMRVVDRDAELYDPINEDLRSEAVLAALEGRDPAEAVREARRAEGAWRRRIVRGAVDLFWRADAGLFGRIDRITLDGS